MSKSFFDQIIQGLFPEKPKESSTRLIVHELLSRSDNFKKEYSRWRESDKDFIIRKIDLAYQARKSGHLEGPMIVHILNSSTSKGFAASFDSLLTTKKEFQFLLEHFKDIILTYGYKIATADHKMIEKDKVIVSTERYYLKPRTTDIETPICQKFGNIILEHILNNDQPTYLKLMVNSYHDRNYQKPEAFQKLTELLFKG